MPAFRALKINDVRPQLRVIDTEFAAREGAHLCIARVGAERLHEVAPDGTCRTDNNRSHIVILPLPYQQSIIKITLCHPLQDAPRTEIG